MAAVGAASGCPLRPLEDLDLRCGAALGRNERPGGLRRLDQSGALPPMSNRFWFRPCGQLTLSCSIISAAGQMRPPCHRARRCRDAIPAALLPGLQPHRASLRQTQDTAPPSRTAKPPRSLEAHRYSARPLPSSRVPELHPKRRISADNLSGYRSGSASAIWALRVPARKS
jgi:hypothetical protein